MRKIYTWNNIRNNIRLAIIEMFLIFLLRHILIWSGRKRKNKDFHYDVPQRCSVKFIYSLQVFVCGACIYVRVLKYVAH